MQNVEIEQHRVGIGGISCVVGNLRTADAGRFEHAIVRGLHLFGRMLIPARAGQADGVIVADDALSGRQQAACVRIAGPVAETDAGRRGACESVPQAPMLNEGRDWKSTCDVLNPASKTSPRTP